MNPMEAAKTWLRAQIQTSQHIHDGQLCPACQARAEAESRTGHSIPQRAHEQYLIDRNRQRTGKLIMRALSRFGGLGVLTGLIALMVARDPNCSGTHEEERTTQTHNFSKEHLTATDLEFLFNKYFLEALIKDLPIFWDEIADDGTYDFLEWWIQERMNEALTDDSPRFVREVRLMPESEVGFIPIVWTDARFGDKDIEKYEFDPVSLMPPLGKRPPAPYWERKVGFRIAALAHELSMEFAHFPSLKEADFYERFAEKIVKKSYEIMKETGYPYVATEIVFDGQENVEEGGRRLFFTMHGLNQETRETCQLRQSVWIQSEGETPGTRAQKKYDIFPTPPSDFRQELGNRVTAILTTLLSEIEPKTSSQGWDWIQPQNHPAEYLSITNQLRWKLEEYMSTLPSSHGKLRFYEAEFVVNSIRDDQIEVVMYALFSQVDSNGEWRFYKDRYSLIVMENN